MEPLFTKQGPEVNGLHFLSVRPLRRSELSIGEWSFTEASNYSLMKSCTISGYATLTLHPDLQQELKIFYESYNDWGQAKKCENILVRITNEVTYQGISRSDIVKRTAKFNAALNEVKALATDEWIDNRIKVFNAELQQSVDEHNKKYSESVVRHYTKESTYTPSESDDVLHLDHQIEILRVQLNALVAYRRKKMTACVRENWEADKEYPEDVRKEVIVRLNDHGLSGSRVIHP